MSLLKGPRYDNAITLKLLGRIYHSFRSKAWWTSRTVACGDSLFTPKKYHFATNRNF